MSALRSEQIEAMLTNEGVWDEQSETFQDFVRNLTEEQLGRLVPIFFGRQDVEEVIDEIKKLMGNEEEPLAHRPVANHTADRHPGTRHTNNHQPQGWIEKITELIGEKTGWEVQPIHVMASLAGLIAAIVFCCIVVSLLTLGGGSHHSSAAEAPAKAIDPANTPTSEDQPLPGRVTITIATYPASTPATLVIITPTNLCFMYTPDRGETGKSIAAKIASEQGLEVDNGNTVHIPGFTGENLRNGDSSIFGDGPNYPILPGFNFEGKQAIVFCDFGPAH